MDENTMSASSALDGYCRSGQTLSEVYGVSSAQIQPADLGIGQLFWSMRDAVVVGDVATGSIVLWNPAAERLFGWSAQEVTDAPLERIIPERLRTAHREGLNRYAALGSGPLVDRETAVDVPAVRKDGTEITVELSLTPLSHLDTTKAGISRFVVAFARDATERTRLATERATVLAAAQDYTQRLEELATLKSCFIEMVAHEMGGPTAAIGALANLLARGTATAEQYCTIVQAIRSEVDILHRLVKDIQTASAIERDGFAVRTYPVPVATLVADAVAFARTLADNHQLRDNVTPEALAMRVEVDPVRIGQVMRNLLGNAVKHTPPGTSVEFRVSKVHERVRFGVADTGPGILPADLERIFAKFARGRDAEDHETPGVGLGLYLARQILRAHGTELRVSSITGKGTILTFELERSA
jgi:PAS domain S-box-containing protein